MIRRRTITSYVWNSVFGNKMVILSNCIRNFFRKFELLGNSTQSENPAPDNPQEIKSAGRKSKNLFNIADLRVGRVQRDGTIDKTTYCRTVILDVPEDAKYRITFKINTDYNMLYFTDAYINGVYSNPYVKVYGGNSGSLISLKNGKNILSFRTTKDDATIDFPKDHNIMIAAESETLDYEPCGYFFDIKITGKNLFDESNVKKGYITVNDTIQNTTELRDEVYSDYIPVVYKNVLMTLQANIPQSEQLWSAIAFYTDDKTFIKRVAYIGLTGKSELKTKVEMMENARFIRVTYRRYGNGKMMINSGETYLPYEPYTEQILTLTSDRPITKWDKLVEQGGEYGWLYGSKIYVVTGNEVFESRDGYNIESYTNRFFILNDLLKENDALKPLAYMKCLRNVQYVYSPNIFEEGFETNINQFHMKLSNDRVGILSSDDHAVRTAKFSEYLKKIHKNGNPIEILYATTDTVFLPLPESVQQQLQALHSENGTTHVFVDSGEVECGINIEYKYKS